MSYLFQNFSIFHSVHPKDISSVNNVANANTEIVRVGSLSATFERQCKFYVLYHACVASDSSATVLRFSDPETDRMVTALSLRSPLVTSKLPTTSTMSLPLHTPTSSSHFKQILGAALSEYKKMTGNDLLDSRLANELQSCDSAEAVLDIIQDQAKAFDKFWNGDKSLMKWIGSSVHALYMISGTLGEGGDGIVRINSDV